MTRETSRLNAMRSLIMPWNISESTTKPGGTVDKFETPARQPLPWPSSRHKAEIMKESWIQTLTYASRWITSRLYRRHTSSLPSTLSSYTVSMRTLERRSLVFEHVRPVGKPMLNLHSKRSSAITSLSLFRPLCKLSPTTMRLSTLPKQFKASPSSQSAPARVLVCSNQASRPHTTETPRKSAPLVTSMLMVLRVKPFQAKYHTKVRNLGGCSSNHHMATSTNNHSHGWPRRAHPTPLQCLSRRQHRVSSSIKPRRSRVKGQHPSEARYPRARDFRPSSRCPHSSQWPHNSPCSNKLLRRGTPT